MTLLRTLATDDLELWAGEKIYSRGQNMMNKVSGLVLTINDVLSAKVQGTQKYQTEVYLEGGELTSFCSCPYEYGECKHAVAVILAAAKQINSGKDIPKDPISAATPRDIELSMFDHSLARSKPSSKKVELAPSYPHTLEALQKMLTKQPKAALVKQLLQLAMKDYETEQSVWQLAEQPSNLFNVKSQVTALKRKIKKITAEESWQDYWNNKGHTPDYTPIRTGFDTLIKHRAFDELVALGEELWTLGIEQIQHSDDEGELANELSRTMFMVLEALPNTKMKPVVQLLWLLDRELDDDFGLLESKDLVYHHDAYQAEHWQDVAMILERRLTGFTEFQKQDFEYKKAVDMLTFAYQKAGDNNAIITIMEKQVSHTKDYVKLVESFVQQGDIQKAKKWCLVGFNDTLKEKPGIARRLKEWLIESHTQEGNASQVAALCVDDFLASPEMKNFQRIERLFQAERSHLDVPWNLVRDKVLHLIEHDDPATYVWPNNWPLPKPEVSSLGGISNNYRGISNNHISQILIEELLIEIAVHENHLDEAVDRFGNRVGFETMTDSLARSLAIAVSNSYPETAISIWKACALYEIDRKKASAYQQAGKHLRQLRMVYQQHQRLEEWQRYIRALQMEHKRKIRLQEVLDNLLNTKSQTKLIKDDR
ncbi:hypothetical protein GV054_19930 [Marinomonas mediterranea]|uniref:SWIM-type domain-containing protein n=1 Tax=Marinomonas mediterranea (strain ATCC 700492 / JCM 21426 / NBRC 103028 / MMB-1) TaxID=717774 RepID=F2JYM8_MARM1|nr:SWIM zinc finger family protein [Marinomonas mediterranea]ADZ93157.1 hypothetical protein Marme_3949 [Marinomonas mediterranea MMB-1]WCN15120.1 hypothetical protein GV054_19930 [Marinomonas mediterranea]WCN19163.1 hypothetical protein GV053_19990 [Marinomonas mediterranea MMB-1]